MAIIYVVDDRPLNRQFLVTLLGCCGHELHQVRDGAKALALVGQRRPDLIILDLVMPVMSGHELVQRLKAEPATAGIPVIFYTAAYRLAEAREIARSCGVGWVLSKPSEPAQILAAVAEALGEGAPEPRHPQRSPAGSPEATAPGSDLNLRMTSLTDLALHKVGLALSGAEERCQTPEPLFQVQAMALKLVALVELNAETRGVREVERLVELYCRASQDILTTRYAAVAILGAEGAPFRHFAVKGVTPAAARNLAWGAAQGGALGQALVTHLPVRLNGLEGDVARAGLPPGHPPVDSFLALPLLAPSGVHGWLYLADRLGQEGFDADDERIALTIGAQLSLAFENIELSRAQELHAERMRRELEERKAIEAELVTANELFRLAFAEAPVGICVMDHEGRFLKVNRRLCQKLGYREQELLAMRFFTLVHPEELPGTRLLFDRLMSGQAEAVELERRYLRRDGRIIWFQVRACLVQRGSGRPHAIAHILDVTERKQAQEALCLSEERFQLAMQGANEGLWDWDLATGEIYYSPRWKSMLGYAAHELAADLESWQRLLHPEDAEATLSRLREVLEGRSPGYEMEFRLRHKEGHYLDILSRGFPVYGKGRRVVRMVGTQVDVTERKRLESQFRQAQKMEAIGQLAGGVAHDFNNILSAIIGYSSLALERVPEGEGELRHFLEQVLEGSGKATALTQSLLAFSRKQTVSLAVIDLNQALAGFEKFLARLIREDITLTTSYSGAPLCVLADRGQIEQVLMNLVANARDAMPQGGTLTISSAPVAVGPELLAAHGLNGGGGYALVSVSDDGTGMDSQTAARIFDPFFTTKEQGKGTGLGLAMVYGIVNQHQGFIDLTSEPGRGTTFRLYLPLAPGGGGACGTELPSPPQPAGGNETVLVGEDDAAVRRLTVKVLRHYGYRVIEAVDGADAVEQFAQLRDQVDLVLLDAIMPRMNGREAYQAMKALAPRLKTIFLSGYARDLFQEQEPFDAATLFLQKPVSPQELLARVRELLDG